MGVTYVNPCPIRQHEFEQLALPHAHSLLRVALRLTGERSGAEDAVQERLDRLQVLSAIDSLSHDYRTVLLFGRRCRPLRRAGSQTKHPLKPRSWGQGLTVVRCCRRRLVQRDATGPWLRFQEYREVTAFARVDRSCIAY